MNTVRKQTTNQNGLVVIKCKKRINKRCDRLAGMLLILVGVLCAVIEKDLTALVFLSFICTPLFFGKKRYIEI